MAYFVQPFRNAQIALLKDCVAHDAAAHLGTGQVCVVEHRLVEVGGFEVGVDQNGAGQSSPVLAGAVLDADKALRVGLVTRVVETREALDDVVRAGKARYIGASSMHAWQFCQALYLAERHGLRRFVSMQNHYNLIYREEEREMMPLCEAEGLGVIPWSPLARGLLARAQTPDTSTATARAETDTLTARLYDHPSDDAVLVALREVAENRGVSPAEVALAWLLSKPAVAAPIIGVTRLAHLDAAVRALDLDLSEGEIETLEAPYQPHAVRGH